MKNKLGLYLREIGFAIELLALLGPASDRKLFENRNERRSAEESSQEAF
jgi:hypothetical protein